MSFLSKAKGKKIEIALDWANIEDDALGAGTPIGSDGQVHNDGQAVGVLMDTADRLWSGTVVVLCAGYVDKEEAETLSGITLTNEAQAALHDIKFSGEDRIDSMVAVAG